MFVRPLYDHAPAPGLAQLLALALRPTPPREPYLISEDEVRRIDRRQIEAEFIGRSKDREHEANLARYESDALRRQRRAVEDAGTRLVWNGPGRELTRVPIE